jgi:hypothetical protein
LKAKLLSGVVVVTALILVSVPLFAHHGEANYDTSKVIDVKGTVTDFRFINPHVLVYIETKDENGKVEKWICEATSPNLLVRRGWNKTTLKVGDEITASGHRAANGEPLLRLMKIVSNGKEYGNL